MESRSGRGVPPQDLTANSPQALGSRASQSHNEVTRTCPRVCAGEVCKRISLLDLLQQPIGVIASDKRDVLVGAELFQQRHKLFWI